jgi:hypothetical protein
VFLYDRIIVCRVCFSYPSLFYVCSVAVDLRLVEFDDIVANVWIYFLNGEVSLLCPVLRAYCVVPNREMRLRQSGEAETG